MGSGFLFEDLPQEQEGRMMWYGTVANAPALFTDDLYVILPEFSPDALIGPCYWQSQGRNKMWESGGTSVVHDILPQIGNPCLVIFDNRHQPWVVAWVPT